AHPNFDPAGFVRSRDTLYLVAPSHLQAQLAPIVVTLLDQIRSQTYRRARGWPPVLFALDEAANIAPLPDLPAILAEGGSQGLVTLTCLQDLSQARVRWGSAANGFLTLHGAKVALGGIADVETLRALSYVAGNVDVTYTTFTKPTFGTYPGTRSEVVHQRPRIPPETINTLPAGVAYLAHSNYPPLLVTLAPPPPPPPTPDQIAAWRRQVRRVHRRQVWHDLAHSIGRYVKESPR
ncbi:MAG: type IV secretory system conjugative DNA transfer family protein, partial [Acidimicrobiales bacterium]